MIQVSVVLFGIVLSPGSIFKANSDLLYFATAPDPTIHILARNRLQLSIDGFKTKYDNGYTQTKRNVYELHRPFCILHNKVKVSPIVFKNSNTAYMYVSSPFKLNLTFTRYHCCERNLHCASESSFTQF